MLRVWLIVTTFLLAFGATVASGLFLDEGASAAAAQAKPARSCPARHQVCPAGPQGNGGCYQPGQDRCYGGRVCSRDQVLCPKGNTGVGGCMKQLSGVICVDGLRCPVHWSVCRRGAKGPGGCYQNSEATCDSGRIVKRPRR